MLTALHGCSIGQWSSALWVLNFNILKTTYWSWGFTNNVVEKISKELMKICKHFATLSVTSIKKKLKKSAYDCECHVVSITLAEHQQQDYV